MLFLKNLLNTVIDNYYTFYFSYYYPNIKEPLSFFITKRVMSLFDLIKNISTNLLGLNRYTLICYILTPVRHFLIVFVEFFISVSRYPLVLLIYCYIFICSCPMLIMTYVFSIYHFYRFIIYAFDNKVDDLKFTSSTLYVTSSNSNLLKLTKVMLINVPDVLAFSLMYRILKYSHKLLSLPFLKLFVILPLILILIFIPYLIIQYYEITLYGLSVRTFV